MPVTTSDRLTGVPIQGSIPAAGVQDSMAPSAVVAPSATAVTNYVTTTVDGLNPERFVALKASTATSNITNALVSAYEGNYLQPVTYGYNAAGAGNFNLANNKKLYGAGPSKTIIRINDANGVNGYIARFSSVSDVLIEDITFDCNATGNPLQTFVGGFDSSGSGSVNITFRNCVFKDGKARPFVYVNGARWLFENCTFQDHTDVMMNLGTSSDTTQVIFRRCFFTNYSSAGSNCCVRLSPRCKSTVFDTCYFLNVGSDQFAIEYPTGSSVGAYITGLVVRNCLFDGNDFGGSGVSGPMENGLIVGNQFIRGQNSHRTGIECVGRNNIVRDNLLFDGAILMAEVNPTVEPDNYSKSQLVINNIFVWTKNTGTQMRMLDIEGQEGTLVQGNIFNALRVPNVPGSPNIHAITFGANNNKFCGRLQVKDNIFIGPATQATSACLRLGFGQTGSTLSVGIKIRNNVAYGGWQTFVQDDATGDTDFALTGNDIRGLTGTGNLLTGAGRPGARYERSGNIRKDGTKELTDIVTVAAAGTYTPNCYGLTDIDLTFSSGNMTIGAPVDPQAGQRLSFVIHQDGVGGRTITWDAAYVKAADGAGTASQRAITSFVYDGASWRQQGGALTYYT